MPYDAKVFQVLIASPGDVREEREIARDALHEWNDLFSSSKRTVLLPVGWESHSAPMLGDRAQEIINKQVLEKCDYLIGIFWTRLGTPTGEFDSGTVEEIEKHMLSGKPASIYFSSRPVAPESFEPDQYRKLQEFKDKCTKWGLIQQYDDLADFRDKLRRHLVITLQRNECFRTQLASDTPSIEALAQQGGFGGKVRESKVEDRLSDEAKELLIEASKDPSGSIIKIRVMGGTIFQTNSKKFGEMGNPRSEARWSAVLDQLCAEELLEPRGYKGEVFGMTDLGYQVADRLKSA